MFNIGFKFTNRAESVYKTLYDSGTLGADGVLVGETQCKVELWRIKREKRDDAQRGTGGGCRTRSSMVNT